MLHFEINCFIPLVSLDYHFTMFQVLHKLHTDSNEVHYEIVQNENHEIKSFYVFSILRSNMEITIISCPIWEHSEGHNMGHQRLSSSSLKGIALYMDLETTKWVWCRTLGSHWNFCNRYSAKTPLANLKIGAKTRMAPRTTQMTMRPFANKLGNNKASLTYKN